MKIYVFKGENGQWYWHVKSSNGRIVCQSEGYQRKTSALKVIKNLQLKLRAAVLVVS